MLAQDSAEIDTPDPLSETEKDLVMKVKCFMMREGVTLPELTSEIGVDINTLRSLTRYGMGIDEDPSMLPQSMRADAIQKLSSWVIDRESEEETVYQVERRMPGIHTFSSLAKHLGIDASRLGQLLTSQTSDWSPGEHAYKRKMLGLLSTWLDSDAEDDIAGIASTKTFDRLQKAYEQAFIKKRIVSIVGEVGIGKSLAAKHYWRQYPKTRRSNGVVYVEFRTGDTKENSILGRIVEVLYGQGLISTLSGDPMTIIEDTLGPEDQLLADEFHFTIANGNRGGEVFHSLYNATGMSIVLQGNASLTGTLWNDKKQPFQGLADRAWCFNGLSTTEEDVKAWMHWAGHDNEALIRAAVKVAARPGQSGGLRTLSLLIEMYEAFHQEKKLTAQSFTAYAMEAGKYPKPQKKGGAT